MSKTIDYYYALNSPFAYMGGPTLDEIARRHGAVIDFKPVSLAKIFPQSGGLPLPKRAPQRQAYRLIELARWRDLRRMPLNLQPAYFPADETLAAKMIIAAKRRGLEVGKLTHAIQGAVWAEERNIADPDTLVAIAGECGMDGAALLAAAEAPDVAEEYEGYTEEALARNVFGSPFYFYKGVPYWGQDRLDFLERALAAD